MIRFFTSLFFIFFSQNIYSQIILRGALTDSSKINAVENAKVVSTGGSTTVTDSLGRYSIEVLPTDSIYFIFNGKQTKRFPVSSAENISQFDIALNIKVKSRYKVLKEVIVFTKRYREDSLENREAYSKIFNFVKPGFQTSTISGGGVGLDLDQLINMFRFRRNKQMKAFQKRLETEEQEKYVDYRFNKKFIHRLTQLQSPMLDSFMTWYRPNYEFTANSSEIEFNKYIFKCLSEFRYIFPLEGYKPSAKKDYEH